jgi:hypothetical protein
MEAKQRAESMTQEEVQKREPNRKERRAFVSISRKVKKKNGKKK